MKVTRVFLLTALFFSIAIGASAQSWKIDKGHSSVGFTVRHMVVSKVNGDFGEFEGSVLNFDGKNLSNASVEITIQTASVDTKNAKRDEHLRSADFLAADSFPTIVFKSTKVIPGEGNKFQILGEMTVRGVTKPVTFDAEFNGEVEAFGGHRAGFSASTKINRQDFGVKWSKSLDNGGLVASDNVDIQLEVEAVKQQAQG